MSIYTINPNNYYQDKTGVVLLGKIWIAGKYSLNDLILANQ